MESLTSGTLAGMGSFRCAECGYVVALVADDELPECPGCGGRDFNRASLFGGPQFAREVEPEGTEEERRALLAEARGSITEPGQYLVFEQDGEVHAEPLQREWTRIGRSLVADVRFDDPTVSRRHALIVRQADGVRVLDDRSLNGVFVNGERVEWRTLREGDEILVGRYRLHFMDVSARDRAAEPAGVGAREG
jgi:DNA-directed RNA polymerase subunit RPC12/RpoP